MDDDALRFAERVISLVDSGRRSATYKLASLLALIDVAAEHTTPAGPPTVLSAREVGRRVIELYWPQTRVYGTAPSGPLLRQSSQNDIPAKLSAFRRSHGLSDGATLDDAKRSNPSAWDTLERELIATVIGMPLAKLQRFGDGRVVTEQRFIYEFGWRDEVAASSVNRANFDDRLHLQENVGAWLVRLEPLLRPLIESKWIELVAKRNPALVDSTQLSEFLFGASRISLQRLRGPLADLQRGRCFYCDRLLGGRSDVDHFIPWSRHPDNTLDNLVASHPACNNAKSSSIAAELHLESWVERLADDHVAQLDVAWPRRRERTLGAVTATYLWLPDETPLWLEARRYEPVDHERVKRALATAVRATGRPMTRFAGST